MRALGSLALVASSAVTASLLLMLSLNTTDKSVRPIIGLYEPAATREHRRHLDLEILFLAWSDPKAEAKIKDFLARAKRLRRIPFLTLEPFPCQKTRHEQIDLAVDVLTGKHDKNIDTISHTFSHYNGPILLRFAHEMDITGQYPWSLKNENDYIKIYRYFYKRITGQGSRELYWVWSPAGKPKANLFWPGKEYVDVIGLSVFASRAWTADHSLQSFSEQLQEKMALQRRFQKPVIIAEVGVSGTDFEQTQWILEAIASLYRFPSVCGFVYFQAPQPSWMPLKTGHEDWQLKPNAMRTLMNQLPLQQRIGSSCIEA